LSLAAAIRPSLGAEPQPSSVISLDGTWQLAVDPQNAGREQKWFEKNPAETKEARVPGIIQECYPCYHGVATPSFPWGVQVSRQRLAGNTPEFYQLSPTGTAFNRNFEMMANLYAR
jgi:beta-galactosidase/beta-glucuronidase